MRLFLAALPGGAQKDAIVEVTFRGGRGRGNRLVLTLSNPGISFDKRALSAALQAAALFEKASGLDRMLPIDPRPG